MDKSPASEMSAEAPLSDTTAPSAAVSSSAAVESGSDPNRKFIRTADLRFRVPDVIKTTYKIEDIIKANGGFVSLTNLASAINSEENKPLTADSSLIVTHFTITNTMTLRVPNTELDTTLKQIAPLIEFMDYRIIKATDVGLDLLSNNLARQRSQKHEARVAKAADAKGGKPGDVAYASESILRGQETADQALVSNLALMDQISFSTINLEIYQRPSVKYSLIANERNISAYEPEFGTKVVQALQSGFDVFKMVLLFLLEIWWFILIGAGAFILYRRNKRKRMTLQ